MRKIRLKMRILVSQSKIETFGSYAEEKKQYDDEPAEVHDQGDEPFVIDPQPFQEHIACNQYGQRGEYDRIE